MPSQPAAVAEPAQKPTIFLLSLENQPWFDEMYDKLIDALANRAEVKRSSNSDSAVRYLANNSPSAIIITDPGITVESNREALDKLKTYISNGGTAIFGCNFSSFIKPPDMNALWRSTFDVPWQFGDYHRTTVYLNHQAATKLKSSPEHLKSEYSQKAVFLKGVDSADALYLPSAESVTQSHVFPSGPVDKEQTPVVWAKFEKGWIGYIGDVNAEEGSNEVILTMCGL